MVDSDRSVHARLPDGAEVVRYDRAGMWYMERPGAPRTWLKLADAISWASVDDAKVFYGLPGGSRFDRAVRRARGQQK